MPILKVLLFIVIFNSCKSERINFLNNFIDKDKVNNETIYTAAMDAQDLDIILATNEINEPVFKSNIRDYKIFILCDGVKRKRNIKISDIKFKVIDNKINVILPEIKI